MPPRLVDRRRSNSSNKPTWANGTFHYFIVPRWAITLGFRWAPSAVPPLPPHSQQRISQDSTTENVMANQLAGRFGQLAREFMVGLPPTYLNFCSQQNNTLFTKNNIAPSQQVMHGSSREDLSACMDRCCSLPAPMAPQSESSARVAHQKDFLLPPVATAKVYSTWTQLDSYSESASFVVVVVVDMRSKRGDRGVTTIVVLQRLPTLRSPLLNLLPTSSTASAALAGMRNCDPGTEASLHQLFNYNYPTTPTDERQCQ